MTSCYVKNYFLFFPAPPGDFIEVLSGAFGFPSKNTWGYLSSICDRVAIDEDAGRRLSRSWARIFLRQKRQQVKSQLREFDTYDYFDIFPGMPEEKQ